MQVKNAIKKLLRHRDFKYNLSLSFMILPLVTLLIMFNYIPLFGLTLAFKRFNIRSGIWGSPWSGFTNFEFFLKSDAAARITFNTLYLNFIFIITGTILAIAFAVLLKELWSKRLAKFSQSVMFFPYFISWVIVSYLSYALLSMDYGLINSIRISLGFERIMWYNEPSYWPFILTIANAWKGVGYSTVIYLAGMHGINEEYYEAARVDGAGKLRQFLSITLPLLMPLIIILMLLSIGRIMYADFGMFYNLTRLSGPIMSTTDVFDTYIFRLFRRTGDIGMSSAANFIQAIVGFFMVLSANLVVRKIDSEKALF